MRCCPLVVSAIVAIVLGCDRRETPLTAGGNDSGRANGSCVVELQIPVEADLPSVHAAAAAWSATGGPRVSLVRVGRTTSFEDGRSQVTLGVPGAHCKEVATKGESATCLDHGQEGVTRQRLNQDDVVVESDVVLDRRLLAHPARLYEVWLHELGHVLGLDHFPGRSEQIRPDVSVMTNPAPHGSTRPGTADLRALSRAYGGSCPTRKSPAASR